MHTLTSQGITYLVTSENGVKVTNQIRGYKM